MAAYPQPFLRYMHKLFLLNQQPPSMGQNALRSLCITQNTPNPVTIYTQCHFMQIKVILHTL